MEQRTMSTTPNSLPTNSPSWGFHGMIADHADADAAWALAMASIAAATSCVPHEVHDFLDSRHGRHFADDVGNGINAAKNLNDAIAAATARWMGWRIGRAISRDLGIPQGLPYLTGFVVHAAIAADSEAYDPT
jgi:hypothetical protein